MTASPLAAGSSPAVAPTAMHRAAGPPAEPPRLRAFPDAPPSDVELIARSVDDQLDVTVNGRPAQLVRVAGDLVSEGQRSEGWYMQAHFAGGTTFAVQAPGSFTQEQVLKFAEQVIYHP